MGTYNNNIVYAIAVCPCTVHCNRTAAVSTVRRKLHIISYSVDTGGSDTAFIFFIFVARLTDISIPSVGRFFCFLLNEFVFDLLTTRIRDHSWIYAIYIHVYYVEYNRVKASGHW
jgi:hypothetical protein